VRACRVVGGVGPVLVERRLGLVDEDGSPGLVAKLLVDVAVSSAHRCFCGVWNIDPQQRSTVKGLLPLLTICSPTVRIHLDVVAHSYGKPAGQGHCDGHSWTRRDGLVGSNPGIPTTLTGQARPLG
jgi:hypothetical protein